MTNDDLTSRVQTHIMTKIRQSASNHKHLQAEVFQKPQHSVDKEGFAFDLIHYKAG